MLRDEALGLVTLVGAGDDCGLSTYMITFSHKLYQMFEPVLGLFERKGTQAEPDNGPDSSVPHDVILFGLGQYGLGIAGALRDQGKQVLGIDFSPEAVRHARSQGFDTLFGDATGPEFLAHLPLGKARWLVLAVPEHHTGSTHDDPRRALLRAAQDLGYTGKVAVAAHQPHVAEAFARGRADLVLMPYRDAAYAAARMIASDEAARCMERATRKARRISLDRPCSCFCPDPGPRAGRSRHGRRQQRARYRGGLCRSLRRAD